MHLHPELNPRVQAMSLALLALIEERDTVSREDLLARGFTRHEIDAFGDDAIAAAAQRYEASETVYSRAQDTRRAEKFLIRIGDADEPAYLACLHPRRFTTEIAEAQRWNTKGTAEKAAAALPPSYRAEAVIESLKP